MSLSSLKSTLSNQVTSVSSKETDCKTAYSSSRQTLFQLTTNPTTFTDTDLASYITAQSALVTKRIAMADALSNRNTTLANIISVQAVPPTNTPSSVSTSNVTGASVIVSFTNPSGTTSNTITATPTSGPVVTATFTSGSPYTLTGLSGITSYSIVVTASNAYGSTTSNSVSITTQATSYVPSFGAYTTVNDNPPLQASRWQLCNSDQRLVFEAGNAMYFMVSPFTGTATNFFNQGGRVCLTPDGSRGVLAIPSDKIYSFSWTGSTYGNFTAISSSLYSSVQNQSWAGASMTADGSKVVIIGGAGVYWMGGWNGTVYTTWTQTLDTSSDLTTNYSNQNWGVGVSQDGSKIVYTTGDTQFSGQAHLRYALWNGTNYDSGTRISNTPNYTGFTPVFHPNGAVVFIAYGGFGYPYMYSVFNSATNTFGPAVAISTSSIPIGASGFGMTISSDGSYLLTGAYAKKIYKTTVTVTAS